jgi:hypothetical protein
METMLNGPSIWDRFYDLNGILMPNVVMDIAVVGLAQAGIEIEAAGRIFLLFNYLLFVSGFWILARATGNGSSLKLILGGIVFYNTALFYGLINFQLGLAVLLWFVAFWLQAGTRAKLVLAVLGTGIVFLCHLVAAFLYVGVLGCLDLTALATSRGRSLFRSFSLVALVTAAGLLTLSPTSGDTFVAAWIGAGSVLGLLHWKASIFAKTMLGGGLLADLVLVAGVALLVVVVALGCRVRLAWQMVLVIAATIAVTLVAPQAVGAGSFLDLRIAIVPLLFVMACTRIVPRSAVWASAIVIVAATAAITRAGALTLMWSKDNAIFAELDEALAKLPPGSVLLGGFGQASERISWNEYWSPPVANSASHGVVHGLFVPSVFANPFQQPLALKPAYRKWNANENVSDTAALARSRARAAPLCSEFPAGVHMLIHYPSAVGLPGMQRIGATFGLVDMCGDPQ